MRQITGFFMAMVAAALVACATPAAAPPAPVAVAANTTAANHVAAQNAPAVASTDPDKINIPYGYVRVKMDNGEERFCRNDLATGSRTEHTRVCLTAEQLKASQDNSQQFIDSMQLHGGASTMTGTPGAGK
jgi:hypothetical protein